MDEPRCYGGLDCIGVLSLLRFMEVPVMETLVDVKQHAVRTLARGLDREKLQKLEVDLFPCEHIGGQYVVGSTLQYPQIDLDFLRMRDNQGWPRFVAVSLRKTKMRFMVEVSSRSTTKTKCNAPRLMLYFGDVCKRMAKVASKRCGPTLWDRCRVTLASRFTGLIPTTARQRIQELPKGLDIYLIAEAGEWEINTTTLAPIDRDPLIVAHHANGGAYLIDSFDTTPVEEMVRREFTL